MGRSRCPELRRAVRPEGNRIYVRIVYHTRSMARRYRWISQIPGKLPLMDLAHIILHLSMQVRVKSPLHIL
ncbi:uncharacterized protein K460DRAFT_11808 [Cucurbitaria berberidis CBS 394.84]|uniref:Uncharacterized protein n=1 Tax=Cucurbitaria berberidis CBS 394.84 TaxID=1168544 RepID=A0A9P4GPD0_9PLEO|nr:uncharacterized protein K460DRAFT_11808 [Cucurbitaria berberidis CBS 394.84]KAF1850203.1 hypothetical protein K460DRAFT_11808 [Cucurbitaria berberidis CBS 394.84]